MSAPSVPRVDALWAIEQIKQLKARYCRLLDERNWDEWAALFSPGIELVIESDPRQHLRGRDEVVRSVSSSLAGLVSVHHVHGADVVLHGERTAVGTWQVYSAGAAETAPGQFTHQSFGYYRDELELTDGLWRFTRVSLRRHLFMPTARLPWQD